jgi:hypothetical protein
MEKELIEAINSLKTSVDNLTEATSKLHTIQTDIFNVDTSHDTMTNLAGRIVELTKAIEDKL